MNRGVSTTSECDPESLAFPCSLAPAFGSRSAPDTVPALVTPARGRRRQALARRERHVCGDGTHGSSFLPSFGCVLPSLGQALGPLR